MASFYLDHNVKALIANALRDLGHDAVTAKDLGHDHAHDEEQLLIAVSRGEILVTSNRRDFRLLHRAWRLWSVEWGTPRTHPGIIVVPQQRWLIEEAAGELTYAVNRFGPDLTLRLLDWRPSTGWYEVA